MLQTIRCGICLSMLTLAHLIELCGFACSPWGDSPMYHAMPPTARSVERISTELNLRLPQDFITLAEMCPVYGGWFASIGEDYARPIHILELNRWLHTEIDVVDSLVMFNHGHDGDCSCWDLRSLSDQGEHPIVDCKVDVTYFSGGLKIVRRYNCFREYLEVFCRAAAPCTPVRQLRRKAKRLLAANPPSSQSEC